NFDFKALTFPSHVANGDGDMYAGVGWIASTGVSNYNSLQISATKGMTHGLIFQTSYTYSHSLDNGSSFEDAGFGGARGYNQFFPSLNYGNSNFDARHRFVFSPVYEVPYRHSGVLGYLLGGWEIGSILTLQSGFPFDISYGGGVSNSLWCDAGDN